MKKEQNQWCKLTPKGIEAFGGQKVGIILGKNKDKDCLRIQWWGKKSRVNYHKDFIQEIMQEEKDKILNVQTDKFADNDFEKWFSLLWKVNNGDFRNYKGKKYLKKKIKDMLIIKKVL